MASRSGKQVVRSASGICVLMALASAQGLHWNENVGLPPGLFGSNTMAMTTHDDGSGRAVYVENSGIVSRRTGNTWVFVGGNSFNDEVLSLCEYDAGQGPMLYAGGLFTAFEGDWHPLPALAVLDQGLWQPLPGGFPITQGSVHSMVVFDGGSGPKLYVGGLFGTTLSTTVHSLLAWDGTTWSPVGSGLTGLSGGTPWVSTMIVFDDGTGPALYVGGQFRGAGSVLANGIAKWDGSHWSALGAGFEYQGLNGTGITTLAGHDDGTGRALYAGGYFTSAGGVPAVAMAMWKGGAWHAVPGIGPASASVSAIASFDDGRGPAVFAGLSNGFQFPNALARWDGHEWSSLGQPLFGDVRSFLVYPASAGQPPALWVGGLFGYVGANVHSARVAQWGACNNAVDAICFGDGSFSACPCASSYGYATSGHGCKNSASTAGALLSAIGTTQPDALVLSAVSEPASSTSIFLQSDALRSQEAKFGDGILCVGGQIRRLYVKSASAGTVAAPDLGDPPLSQRSAALGDTLAVGAVRYYQVWYRDASTTFCPPPAGSDFNITNGLRVVW